MGFACEYDTVISGPGFLTAQKTTACFKKIMEIDSESETNQNFNISHHRVCQSDIQSYNQW
jgi:hypothetical protein